MASLVLDQPHWEAMRAHVAAENPLEACGLVAGKQGRSSFLFPIRNEAASPTRFRMNGKQQLAAFQEMERAGWDLLAIYHSHPAGPAEPSPTDLAEVTYPGVIHLIWSPAANGWGCRAFLLDNGRALPIEFYLSGE